MLIVRAPVRISFFGGGTDLPSYYTKHGGAVLSASINKYFYTLVTELEDRKVQLIEATDCDRLLSRSADFESLIRMLAQTTPHEGQWEQSYRRFQEAARRLLAK